MAQKVWQAIDKGELASIYLIVGEEQMTHDETIRRIEKKMREKGELEKFTYDLEQVPVEAVVEEADTVPFFSDYKLIIAKNAAFLKAEQKSREKIDHRLGDLEKWLANPSPTAITIFTAPYEKVDNRKKITKLMKEKATLVEAERLSAQDLVATLLSYASKENVHLSKETAEFFVARVGENLTLLHQELMKLATTVGEGGEITEELIRQFVTRTPEMDVFTLTNAFVQRNVSEAIRIYRDLLANGEEPIMLTALIAGQIRLMLNVATLQRKGLEQQSIAQQLKVHPFRVKLVMQNRQKPTEEQLFRALDAIATVDYQLKTSSMNREQIIELFLMKA